MTKARDFAMMVGRSEAINPTRVALLDGNTITVTDSASVSSIIGNVGTAVYDSLGALPVAGLTAGQQAFVSANDRLYISNGNGWYNVATINATPTLTTSPTGTIALAAGSATVVTMTAADSDGTTPALSLESGGDLFKFATISQDSSVVTITPRSEDSAVSLGSDGSATLTFKASDGIGVASVVNTFTLSFGPDWSASPTQSTLVASNGSNGDQFGHSVSINSDATYAIVGAPRYESTATYSNDYGSIYIYSRSGSTWTQQYLAGGTEIQEYIGHSVSISGDGSYAIAGAYAEDYISGAGGVWNSGRINIWVRSGSSWSSQAFIRAGDIGADNYFGVSVDINNDGSYAIAGATGVDTGGTDAGAAYIFTRSGTSWSQQQKIQHSDISNVDNFGSSVAINSDGTYAIVGASGHSSSNTGAAYIFVRSGSTWTQQAKIVSSDLESSDFFGTSVSISSDGSYVIVGAPGEDTDGSGAGSTYIFTRSGSTWTQQQKIQSSDVQAGDGFGNSVSISGDTNHAIVGAAGEDTGFTGAGSSYIFSRSGSTWTEQRILRSPTALEKDFFGKSVSMSSNGSYVLVGANEDDGGRVSNGTSYIYEAS